MYTILGASGNTGRIVAETLLAAGKKVRVVGRDGTKLDALVSRGAEAHAGAIDDAAFLERALRGARAIYALIPPDYTAPDFRGFQNRIGAAITRAVEAAGVEFVVNLSSLGGDLSVGSGPILGLHDQEERLNGLGNAHVLHLRPTFFMENLFGSIPALKQMGVFGTALRGDLRFPMIATRDIGAVAARRLIALDFSGKSVLELLGPRDVTLNEVTPILGAAVGKAGLGYVQFPYDAVRGALVGMGMSPDMAGRMMELQRSMNEGKVIGAAARSPETTTPTTIEEFAPVFAAVYAAS